MNFAKDNYEFELIDQYPSNFQRKYGRPDRSVDIVTRFRPIKIQEHLKRIHNIRTTENKIETKQKKPKVINIVDKSKISHTNI
jgi:hypothetical protein